MPMGVTPKLMLKELHALWLQFPFSFDDSDTEKV